MPYMECKYCGETFWGLSDCYYKREFLTYKDMPCPNCFLSESGRVWNSETQTLEKKGKHTSDITRKYFIFYKIRNSLEYLKERFITSRTVYVCKDRKHKSKNIIIKFNRKDWFLLKPDGTWEYIKSKGAETTKKIKKGLI